MPQNPMSSLVAKNPAGAFVPLAVGANGKLQVETEGEAATVSTHLNITVATVVKATPGKVLVANVVVAGSAEGSINDVATTGGVAAANEIASLPQTVGPIALNFPCAVGIVVAPGTGQTIAVSFE